MNDQRGRIFAWIEVEPDGREGVIVAAVPELGAVLAPLQHRRREAAEMFRPVAELHRAATGRPVRLVEFVRARVLTVLS